MKRFGALVLALMMLASAAFAQITSEEEMATGSMKILRTHEETSNDFQEVVIDYPEFECSDAALQAFLTMATACPAPTARPPWPWPW